METGTCARVERHIQTKRQDLLRHFIPLFIVRRFSAHPMSEARDEMIAALKEIVVPTLRDMGFRGSFPHFRRDRDEQVDLLSFQFSQWGGSFVVEIAHCPASGYTLPNGQAIYPDKARVHHQHYGSRLRLGVRPPPNDRDHWFKFEPHSPSVYSDAALEVLPLLRSQAESYWHKHEHVEPRNA